jgi:hypothetical protein
LFAIDRENGIRVPPEGVTIGNNEALFESFQQFVEISQTRNWSKEDITELWNSFAGSPEFAELKPQKQFKNRQYGLEKIWAAIQRLLEPEHAPDALPTPANALDSPTKRPPNAQSENPTKTMKPKKTSKPKASKPRKTATKAEKKPKAPRQHTKRDEVVRLISRANGATQAEIMEKMGWQPHTVRGFISTLGSKFGIKVTSTKTENKGLIYKVA